MYSAMREKVELVDPSIRDSFIVIQSELLLYCWCRRDCSCPNRRNNFFFYIFQIFRDGENLLFAAVQSQDVHHLPGFPAVVFTLHRSQ